MQPPSQMLLTVRQKTDGNSERTFMSEKKPTDEARFQFGMSQSQTKLAHQISMRDKSSEGMYKSHIAVSLHQIAEGLNAMATGMRATYILLEEVKRLLERRQ